MNSFFFAFLFFFIYRDNFFYHSTVGNDYLPGGLWLGWQYGQYYWRTQTNFHRIRSLTTSGSYVEQGEEERAGGRKQKGLIIYVFYRRLLLTSQVYLSTSFTLQTKAIQWGSTGTGNYSFISSSLFSLIDFFFHC